MKIITVEENLRETLMFIYCYQMTEMVLHRLSKGKQVNCGQPVKTVTMETDVNSMMGPPLPSRPAPPLPSRAAPPPPARPPSSSQPPGWQPLTINSSSSSSTNTTAAERRNGVKKRPVIEVLDARPMSEVGFRDLKTNVHSTNPSVPNRSSVKVPPRPGGGPPPPRPKSWMPSDTQNSGPDLADRPLPPRPGTTAKPARPSSMLVTPSSSSQAEERNRLIEANNNQLTFDNDGFEKSSPAQGETLIDFDSEPISSENKIYPDLLVDIGSTPAIQQDLTPNASKMQDNRPAVHNRPPAAMSQLAMIMNKGIGKQQTDSDDEQEDKDDWGEESPPFSQGRASIGQPPKLPDRPPVPGRPPVAHTPLNQTSSQPDSHDFSSKTNNSETQFNSEGQSAPVKPPAAMSQLALIMNQGIKKNQVDSDEDKEVDEDDDWGEESNAPSQPVSSVPRSTLPNDRPSLPGRPAVAVPPRSVPHVPMKPPAKPSPALSTNTNTEGPGLTKRPLPSLPPRPPSGVPQPNSVSVQSNHAQGEHSKQVDESSQPITRPKPSDAMSQLAYVMRNSGTGFNATESNHSVQDSVDDKMAFKPVVSDCNNGAEFHDSFYSDNEQSFVKHEIHEAPEANKNDAVSSLAAVLKGGSPSNEKPTSPSAISKPQPPTPTKPKPGIKPKPMVKPKPGLLPKPSKPSANIYRSEENLSTSAPDIVDTPVKPVNSIPKSTSAMANLASVMCKKSEVSVVPENSQREKSIPDQQKENHSADPAPKHIPAVQKKFGNIFLQQNQSDQKPSWMNNKEAKVQKEKSDKGNEPREDKEPPMMDKKPGPAPMRATYRPTIIKPTARPMKSEEKVGKLSSRTTSMFELDKASSQEEVKPKRKPTIIRPPSMGNLSMQHTDKTEPTEEESKPEPRPRPSPQPRSRMSSALSMPNIADIGKKEFTYIQPVQQNSETNSMTSAEEAKAVRNLPPPRPTPPDIGEPDQEISTAKQDSDSEEVDVNSTELPDDVQNNDEESSSCLYNEEKEEKLANTGTGPGRPRAPSVEMGLRGGPPPRPSAAPKVGPPRPVSGPSKRPSQKSAPVQGQGATRGMPPKLPDRPGPGHPLYHYVVSGPHAIALFDYPGSQDGDLTFKAGDVIALTKRLSEDWLEGRSADGKVTGIFPSNFVDVVKAPSESSNQDVAKERSMHQEPVTLADNVHGPRCRARYDYESDQPGDLKFRTGDMISLKGYEGDEWLRGELNGEEGIFPVTFVEIVEDLPPPVTGASGGQITEAGAAHAGNIVHATFDFNGEEGDLSFKAGSEVCVLSRVSADWLFGEQGGRQGQFPATYVDQVPANLPQKSDDMQKSSSSQSASSASTGHIGQCVASYSFPGETEGDLPFQQGEVIDVIEEIDSDWLRGTLNGRTGSFPRGFVTFTNQAGAASIPEASYGEAKALFDFPGQTEDDLSFSAGEQIVLIEIIDDAWMKGRLNDREGVFPANFVEVVKPVS